MGSTVFRDMLEVGSSCDDQLEEIPTVTLSEEASTLENILPFFYDGYVEVDSLDFEEAIKAFEAGCKYGMAMVEYIYDARLR